MTNLFLQQWPWSPPEGWGDVPYLIGGDCVLPGSTSREFSLVNDSGFTFLWRALFARDIGVGQTQIKIRNAAGAYLMDDFVYVANIGENVLPSWPVPSFSLSQVPYGAGSAVRFELNEFTGNAATVRLAFIGVKRLPKMVRGLV